MSTTWSPCLCSHSIQTGPSFCPSSHHGNAHGPSLLGRLPAIQGPCPVAQQGTGVLSQLALTFLCSFCIGHSGASLCTASLARCTCSQGRPRPEPRHRGLSGESYPTASLVPESRPNLLCREMESNIWDWGSTEECLAGTQYILGLQLCRKPIVGASSHNLSIQG